jgi:diphosphomevalonate decarboxylase
MGEDSIAVQVANEAHWPLEVLIVVVSDKKKDVSSTSGMQTSVETSTLIQTRARRVVPERLRQFEEAIATRDFSKFAMLTMQDSNQFHAICLDTYPPIFYMNDVSKQIIQLITRYNSYYGQPRAAYTFDAGPNACIYLPKENVDELKRVLQYYFPTPGQPSIEPPEAFKSLLGQVHTNVIDRIIHTRAGPGPQRLSDADSLLDIATGLPITPPHK